MGSNGTELELAVVIVNFELGSKVLKIAQRNGIPVGIVVLGMGTMKNRVLEFLQIADIRKEIVIMAAEKQVVEAALEAVDQQFHFEKPYHGIAFTMPVSALLHARRSDYEYIPSERKENMKQVIITVVDRGMAEDVMESATNAGARGGTIIKARSSGVYETGKLFHMDIEPEKELVMILADGESVETITTAIRDKLGIGSGGNGLIICQDVNNTYGVS